MGFNLAIVDFANWNPVALQGAGQGKATQSTLGVSLCFLPLRVQGR